VLSSIRKINLQKYSFCILLTFCWQINPTGSKQMWESESDDEIFQHSIRFILMWHCHIGFLPSEQEVWRTHIVGFALEKARLDSSKSPAAAPRRPGKKRPRTSLKQLSVFVAFFSPKTPTRATETERERERERENFIYIKFANFHFTWLIKGLAAGNITRRWKCDKLWSSKQVWRPNEHWAGCIALWVNIWKEQLNENERRDGERKKSQKPT
jgi:hypothetical protein